MVGATRIVLVKVNSLRQVLETFLIEKAEEKVQNFGNLMAKQIS